MLDTVAPLLGRCTLIVFLAVIARVPTAHANLPLGACCVQHGGCQNLMETQCADIDGDFVGEGTSCASADCAAPVGAPLLSIFGLVAATGALGGFGVYRLLFRERNRSASRS
jgi:hypothetical protein